jgi:hypothetical protein
MKRLRLIALSVVLTLGAFSAVVYTSCTKDECKSVTCLNGGTCSGGNCTCPTGYEGTTCQDETRKKIIGGWSATDVIDGGTPQLNSSTIAAGSTVTRVLVSGIGGKVSGINYFGNAVTATIDGNTLVIANQEPDNDGYSVSGSGTYDPTNKKITWTYALRDTGTMVINCTGTWTKN